MAGIAMLARIELRRAWRTTVVLGLLAGIGLGVGLATLQLARRTSTAFERLELASGAPDAIVIWAADRDRSPVSDLPAVGDRWDATFSVGRVEGDALLFLGVTAGPRPPASLANPLYVEGRAPDPARDDELVITEPLAREAGLQVGDVLPITFLTADEVTQFDTGFGEPDGPHVRMRVVGIQRTALGQGDNAPGAFSTPALSRRLQAAASTYPTTFVRLRGGDAALPRFERQLDAAATGYTPAAGAEEFAAYTLTTPSLQRSVVAVTARVLVAGLLAFGAVAAAAALLATVLALRRQLLLAPTAEVRALAAVGVTRRELAASRWIAASPFVGIGTVVAVVVAVAGGTLDPLGSLARAEPHPGFHVNVAVLAAGAALVLGLLAAGAAVAGLRVRVGSDTASARPGRIVGRLGAMGAPPAVVIGTGLAFEPARRRTGVPTRSALLATSFAIAGLVGVMLFSSSLDRLTSTPARWGWSADLLVSDTPPAVAERLRADDRVAAVTTMEEVSVRLAGRTVTATVLRGPPSLGWTVLDGRAPRASGEVLLGARVARTLDRSVGDRVRLRDAQGEPVSLAVVGIGTGPRQTDGGFGRGVVIDASDRERLARTDPQRNALVRFASGVDAERATAALATDLEVESPVRPSDVANLSQLGRLPELLAAFLAVVALAVVAHAVVTTAHRRRRELDTLRAVGFVRGQVRNVLVMASTATVAAGLVLGTGIGVVLASIAWRLTARSAYVAGDLAWSIPQLAAFALGALALGAAVALVPAWRVTRRPVAIGLRSE